MSETIRDRLWKKAAIEKIPLSGVFELLPICNFSCEMCYVRKSQKDVLESGGLISGKEWLRYAKEAGKKGMLFPLITGGEPFLHPDFHEIYVGMQNLGMQVSINTNGSMIDKTLSTWLGRYVPVRVNITLYGASATTYEHICGQREAFHKVCNAVDYLKQQNIPIKLNTSIVPQNAHELRNMISFAQEMEVPIQVATYMFPPLRRDASMIGQNCRLSPEDAGQARVEADYLQNDKKWFLKQAQRFQKFVPLDKIDFTKEPSRSMKINCRAGASTFWIDWQGNLMNCGMYGSSVVSLKNNNFESAWKRIVEETLQIRYKPACASCPNYQLCHACITMVYNESGDKNGKPEYLCQMNQAAAKYYQIYADS